MLPLNLTLDFRSGLPIYLQVVDGIQQRIASGQLHPGNQLPTVRTLALELRVNFNTIARSYRILDEMGIISTQQGRGTYILSVPPAEVSKEIRRKSLQALTQHYLIDAERLGASEDELSQLLKEALASAPLSKHLSDTDVEID